MTLKNTFSKVLFSLSFLVLSEMLDLLLLLVMDDDDDELEEDLESCLVIFGNDTLLTSASYCMENELHIDTSNN